MVCPPVTCCGGEGASAAGVSRRLGRILHAFLEALDRAAQILADVAQLLGAENQQTMIRTINQCQMLKEPMSGLR
jgi:hypothetical protein